MSAWRRCFSKLCPWVNWICLCFLGIWAGVWASGRIEHASTLRRGHVLIWRVFAGLASHTRTLPHTQSHTHTPTCTPTHTHSPTHKLPHTHTHTRGQPENIYIENYEKVMKIDDFWGSRGFPGTIRQLSTCRIDWRCQIWDPEWLDQPNSTSKCRLLDLPGGKPEKNMEKVTRGPEIPPGGA